ncbi:MAG TPA: hypothetical protein VIE63_12945 [Ramlibacter sp.]|jgi:hypothetical protein
MNEKKTTSILQRLPVILAVTAASYGLAQPQATRVQTPGGQTTQQSKSVAQVQRR